MISINNNDKMKIKNKIIKLIFYIKSKDDINKN